MKNVPENELLSAYLDGELTAAEQAQVEQLLATSPAARQLLEELRALSATLQSLPQYQLEEDLGPRVLHLAERQMLTDMPESDRRPAPRGFAWWSIPRRLLRPRALVWSGLAVAVAIALMLMEPGRPHRRAGDQLAHAPQAPEEVAESPPIHAGGPAAAETPAELPAKDARSAEKAQRPLVADGAVRKLDKLKVPSAPISEGAPVPSSGVTIAKEAARDHKAETLPEAENRESSMLSGSSAGRASGLSTPGAGAAPALRAAKGDGDVDVAPADKVRVAKGGDAELSMGAAGVKLKQDAGMGGFVVGAPINAGALQLRQAGEGILLVKCYLSAEAAKSHDFDKLLARQQIVQSQSRSSRKLPAEQSAAADAARRKKAGGKAGGAFTFELREAALDDSATKEPPNLVYVEATPVQIEATLAELAAQPQRYLSVVVEPAPGVAAQQSWSQYNRAGQQLPAAGQRGESKALQAKTESAQPQAEPQAAPAAKPAESLSRLAADRLGASAPKDESTPQPEQYQQQAVQGKAAQVLRRSAPTVVIPQQVVQGKAAQAVDEQTATYPVLFELYVMQSEPAATTAGSTGAGFDAAGGARPAETAPKGSTSPAAGDAAKPAKD